MARLSNHLTFSFMPACLRCRTLVDTKVLLLYALCCSVQRRLKAVLLCNSTKVILDGFETKHVTG